MKTLDRINCEHCGERFQPNRSYARFCEPACRNAARKIRDDAQREIHVDKHQEYIDRIGSYIAPEVRWEDIR